jgi:beta-phosphoglucomutase-like phosphatase (HAD superfamily)
MKPTAKYKGLIFDFNGVLLWDDQIQRESWCTFASQLRERPLSDKEIDIHIHGRNGRYTLEYLLEKPIDAKKAAVLLEQKESIYREMCLNMDGDFKLSPGAIELLDDLVRHKIPHTIATASARKNVNFFVEYLKLENWFEIEKIVYDNGRIPGKPAPDLYLEAANKLNLPTETCVVVEDSQSGIQAAHAAGVGWLAALGPLDRHTTLSNLPGVNQVITSLQQIVWQDLFKQMVD